jgi:hypothetical protein
MMGKVGRPKKNKIVLTKEEGLEAIRLFEEEGFEAMFDYAYHNLSRSFVMTKTILMDIIFDWTEADLLTKSEAYHGKLTRLRNIADPEAIRQRWLEDQRRKRRSK